MISYKALLRFLPVVVFIMLLITACEKDEIFIPGTNQINLQSPVVGQENFYLRYSGACGELTPNGDTLVLRIISFDGTHLEFEENFTEHSPSYYGLSTVLPATWSKDFLDMKPDYRQLSQLFYFYGADSLRLNQAADMPLQQNNCIIWNGSTGFRGDFIGEVKNFRVGDLHYGQRKVVSCVPTILDLDAYIVYDKNNIYSSMTSAQGGWFPETNPQVNAYALVNLN